MTTEKGGAGVDVLPSLPEIEDVKKFLEDRVQILYAGSLAQSLQRRKVDDKAASKFLLSTASDDFSKVRELLKVLVGIKKPGATPDEFQAELTKTKDNLFNRSAKIVEKHADLIVDTAVFVMGKLDGVVKAAGTLKKFELTPAELDEFVPLKAAFPS